MGNDIVPVLVIGAGPVGLALAADLGPAPSPVCSSSRATARSIRRARTVESAPWNSAGAGVLSPTVEGSPEPRDFAQDIIYLTGLTGYELGRERFPDIGQAPPPTGRPNAASVARKTCSIRSLRALGGFPERSYCATACGSTCSRTMPIWSGGDRHAATVASEEILARSLVACDGGGSPVRETLGMRWRAFRS